VEDMIFQTDQLAICDKELPDITPEAWETVVGFVSSVLVAERHECSKEIKLAPISNEIEPIILWHQVRRTTS
jgi:hypothetical protein